MNAGKKKALYPTKDVIQILIGIPIVVLVGISIANWLTSYAGL